jgi:molybdopterin-containing oxidoreductase family iron-sulfur binding subunit
MPSVAKSEEGRAYWRSLDELADMPEFRRFAELEFAGSASWRPDSPSRRQFLKLMGASLALAGLTGCRWPEQRLAPATTQPAGRIPGKPVHYATAMELGGVAQGLMITCYDGRPIKVEGNPLHPINRGAADVFAQASVLEFYDPDRSRQPLQGEAVAIIRTPLVLASRPQHPKTWDEFGEFAKGHFAALRQQGGAGLYVLSEASSSPSVEEMHGRLLTVMPQAQWLEYEALSRDNEYAGAAMAFGRPHRALFRLEKADVILCLDADLLGSHPAAIKHARDFGVGRRVAPDGLRSDGGGHMNRLYAVESGYSITGAMADHRLAVKPSEIGLLACRLAVELIDRGLQLPPPLDALKSTSVTGPVGDENRAFVQTLAEDLLAARGRCVVAAGPRQPAVVHALGHILNVALDNPGRTVGYAAESDGPGPSHVEAVSRLAAHIRDGKVDTLLILGGNPAFNAPADVYFGAHLPLVKTSIHLSLYNDETSRLCTWHLPRAHYLESWGDARAYDGTISIIQPTIEPLYGGRSVIELLALICEDKLTKGHDLVRRTFGDLFDYGVNRGALWQQSLHDGIVPDSAFQTAAPSLNTDAGLAEALSRLAQTKISHGVEVVFVQDRRIYDGRFANNGWLQELPDPLTKLTWDNAAIVAPATAKELGVRSGDIVRLAVDDRRLEIATYVLAGHAPGTITLPVGYGRTAAGRVGRGVGFNVFAIRTSQAMDGLADVEIVKTGRRYKLATTQDHQAIDSKIGRETKAERLGELVREATLAEYQARPDFAKHMVHHPPLKSLWQEPVRLPGAARPPEHRWAMAIDLNACIGCGACAVACQAENNIPVVGKDEVERGREMAWIRIDRYFRGEPDHPQIAFQPVACHQCENAPCEQVCPVAATVHSAEGLNDMVYNRCVGTRYCSNNCPYKVRRFNWFNNHRNPSEVEKLAFNPEVTVRSRGVMEKCTYCVQRISAVKIAAKNERRPITDGEIIPACAQTCPTQAIVFGDLNDPASRMARLHAADRSYAMLAELNVKPRTVYLARIRNSRGWKDEGSMSEADC